MELELPCLLEALGRKDCCLTLQSWHEVGWAGGWDRTFSSSPCLQSEPAAPQRLTAHLTGVLKIGRREAPQSSGAWHLHLQRAFGEPFHLAGSCGGWGVMKSNRTWKLLAPFDAMVGSDLGPKLLFLSRDARVHAIHC